MGNFIGVYQVKNSNFGGEKKEQDNIEMINYLKTKDMRDVSEAVELVRDYYPTNQTFDAAEFEEAFSILLDEHTEKFFQVLENSHSLDGQIDLYETLATLVLLCNDDYELKIRFVFELFDFNRNGVIDKQELVLSNQAAIRGLCKIAGLPFPTPKQVEEYSLRIFSQVDKDQGGTISFEEFFQWIKFNWELQDFFLKYANVQTFENAERRCREFKFIFEKLFDKVAGSEADRVQGDLLEPILTKELINTHDGTMNILLTVLKATSKMDCPSIEDNYIYKKSYLAVMKSWGAFDSTDVNRDNKLNIQEIKFLLYAHEGDIPDDERIKYEMSQLDKDKSGFVTRKEWMEYLCVDPSNSSKATFRAGLKDLFNQFDADNSGFLSKVELTELLKQQLSSYTAIYQVKGGSDLQNYNGMVSSIIDEIQHKLQENYKDGQVSWTQFKVFMEKAFVEMDNLKTFLNSL